MFTSIRTLASTRWADPRARLLDLVDLLLPLDHDARGHALVELADTRSDTAPALWFAESSLVGGRSPDELGADIRDDSWAAHLALSLVGAGTFGVASMGPSTRAVLGALSGLLPEAPVVRVASGVIARGIDDLPVLTQPGNPFDSDAHLIPVAAIEEGALWTSPAGATALDTSRNPVLVVDPLCDLGPWALERYRPQPWLVRVERRPG